MALKAFLTAIFRGFSARKHRFLMKAFPQILHPSVSPSSWVVGVQSLNDLFSLNYLIPLSNRDDRRVSLFWRNQHPCETLGKGLPKGVYRFFLSDPMEFVMLNFV